MLDLINRYANGFVAIPVIEACRRRGMFELLTGSQVRLEELVSKLGANEGQLRVALRLLLELGWLTKTGRQSYGVTSSAALAKQLPENIRSLFEFQMTRALRDPDGPALRYWLELCSTGWDGADPALAGLLDGVVLAPLLVGIHQLGGAEAIERPVNRAGGITWAACEAIRAFFDSSGWDKAGRGDFTLNEAGRYVVASGATLGTVVSYSSMLRHIDDLLFGDSRAVFVRDAVGRESHVDRTLNVVSSGSQHQTYFAELEEVICSIFDQLPLERQPRYVCDMGCGDGSLLRRIYHVILQRAARGKVLDRFPLELVGVDFNQEALESTARTLAGLPHRLVRGDIGDPERLMLELSRIGTADPENVLHIRSFLDHDRRVVAPDDQAALARRVNLAYTGVYVDADGRFVRPETAVQSLVEHLSRWKSVVSTQGLILLEVHCLRPETVLAAGNRTESLHFDAYHGFSGQQLVEAPVFLMAAAEAGLFPDRGTARRFPRAASFTRISLNRLVPQPYRARHPVPADLNALQGLEMECVPENLLTPSEELTRRLNLFPEGQAVLEYDGKIAAVLYSQRITSVTELLKSNSANQARLHDPDGRHVQLLGLYVHPEVFGQGLGDQFMDFMLLYFAACEGVDSIFGVTRCLDYWRHRQDGMTLSQYIGWRDDRGRLFEPMLNFHESHGASIRQLVSAFRPEDVLNDGAGVLIEYQIRDSSPERETKVAIAADVLANNLAKIVQDCVLRILTPTRAAAFGPDIPFMAMGLKSMDLLELRYLLEEKIGKELGPTIFFSYGTPSALIAHLKGETDAVREARAVAVRQTEPKGEGIAVIGIGCCFPGEVRGPDAFWTLLLNGSDAITEISSVRRDILRFAENEAAVAKAPNLGGFVSDIDQFDAAFFRISAREARLMDPQHRLLLEIAWEAMEHAGLGPLNLRGSATGVFVGAMSRDYEALIAKRAAEHDFDTYFSTGNASSVAAGRLAYFFDWRGPAMTVDTACSSSLVAVHLACRSLLTGECNLAVAAGVNLLLDPKSYAAFGRAGMLAADGRCKTFDADADGYVRSEGCGAIVLKRLSEARRDGERILAVIRGSALNQDGASGGLTVPNQLSQQEVIEKALWVAQIDPYEVAYLEAHGTGTSLGDPIEVQAAAAALGHGRASDRPLLVGSVKTNIGHLEAAAGIAGVIKVILSLERGRIPRHLHLRKPNPHIPWDQLPVRIASEATPWPAGKRIASVSSFGFSGTNAHVVIEGAAAEAKAAALKSPLERSDHLLALSARDEPALKHLARRYLDWWSKHPDASGPDVGYTAGVGRSHLTERAGLVFNSTDEARQLLARLEEGEPDPRLFRGQFSENVKVAWLFPGESSHYLGMGRELYDTQPVVHEILQRCDQAMFDYGECRLLDAMFERDEWLRQSRYAHSATFALQAAMAALWRSWGYAPEVVLGCGAGQYGAAQVAGALPLEEGLRLTCKRGELIDRLGSADDFLTKLADSEKNPGIAPLLEEFRAYASRVNFVTTKLPMLCNLAGQILPAGSRLDASYWLRHLQEASPFDRDIQKLADLKVNVLVELGPQSDSLGIAEQCRPDRTLQPAKIASLRQGVGENRRLAEAVAQLYALGLTPDFAAWDRPWPRRKIALPTYPFQRTRHWLDMDGPAVAESKTSSLGVESAGTESERVTSPIDRCLYELVWRPRELPPVFELEQSDSWLVLADRQGFANRVAGVLAKFGQKCRLVFLDEIANSTLLEALLEDLKRQEAPLTRVIDLLGLDLPSRITSEALAEMQRVALNGLLAFVQGLSRRQLRARLYLVTRAACAVTPGDTVDPLQAPLWGLGKAISLELPNLWGGIVDIPVPSEGELDPAEGLLAACVASDHEDQVALRMGGRHVPRIQRLDNSATTVSPRLAKAATYLITGGLGELGLATARWLAEQGAGTIVLVSRRSPDEAVQKAIDELRTRCQVHIRSTDISRIEEVRALLAYIAEELPPLRGIVHAAGLTSTWSITELSTDELTKVLAPKVQGTWWLHELTQDAELDFFVGFSSVVSVLGNPGQAHYAAANAFMDAVMWHRQARGMVGTSLNFGPWSGRGMGSQEERRWLELSGINPLAPHQALAGFGKLQHKAQAIIADIDWSKLPKTTFEGHRRAILEELASFDQVLIKTGKTSLTERLERAPATARRSILEEEVRRLIGQVLRTDPEQMDAKLGFFDLGMDSVMAMEFRLLLERALGRALPSTLAMDHPRVGEVANYLLTEVLAFEPASRLEPVRNDTRSQDLAIAVIGLACRVPGAADLKSFWRLLEAGREAIGEIPAERWDMSDYYDPDPEAVGKIYTRFAGLIENVDKFDAFLFGIAPREAVSMDPQQRLLLEISWEALEQANISPASLGRTRTGVYVGAGANEYGNLVLGLGAGAIDAHFSTGNALSTIAGRLAFALGLEGPAMVVDTACSSSLVAVHQACQALRGGECDLALAAGVNLLLSPEGMVATCRARMLAADGRCKTFDSAADGYVRGEGGGVVILKRIDDARRNGDRILAVIRGSAVNQDGRSSGLTVPNGPSQERVIGDALDRAGIKPAEVVYLEAHGTGTNLGDPIEVQAAAAALGKGRKAERPLLIGSVKTNIGHLEAAAGIAGLIKVILAIEHGRIPKHLHFRTPNPHIPWERLAVAVTGEAMSWPEGKKIAGVSSFGFSGTNAHVVIEEPPAESRSEPSLAGERSHHVLVLSARSQSALRQLAGRYRQWLERHPEVRLGDVAYTAGVGRSHLEERAALIIESRERVGQLLASLEQGREAEGLFCQAVKKEPKVAWFFTGQGSQYVGMGRELYQSHAVVREVIDRCDRALRGQREHGLMEVLFKEEALLNHTSYTQPALYALEVALAELWKSWGVEPDVVLGHSVGQYAAAVVAGVMSLEEGLGLIAKRAELMGRLPAGGAMEPVLDEFESYGQTIRFRPAQRRLVCNLTGGVLPAEQVLEAGYWRRHIREPVQFERGVQTVAELGVGVVMEMGPRPALLGVVRDCWPAEIKPAALLATLRPEQNGNQQMAHAFAQCYVHGLNLNFAGWDRSWPRRKLDLPTYPFQRTRYWIEKRNSQSLNGGSKATLSGVRQELSSGEIVQRHELSGRYQPWLADHRVHETVIAPGSLYFTTALAAEPAFSRLSQVVISQPLSFTNWAEMADSSRLVELSIKPPTDTSIGRRFEIHSQTLKAGEKRWTLHAQGTLEISKGKPDHDLAESLAQLRQRLRGGSVDDYYDSYAAIGLQFGPSFQGLTSLWLGTGEALGEIQKPTGLKEGNNPIHPAVLDACFQVLGAAGGPISEAIYVPFTCEALEIWETVPEHFYCYTHLRENSAPETVTGDLWLVDEEDRVLGTIVGLVVKRLSKGLLGEDDQEIDNWFYDVEWQEKPPADVSSELAEGGYRHEDQSGSGKWLIVGDRGGIGEQIAERFRLLGQRTVLLVASGNNAGGPMVSPGFSALDPAAWEQFLGSSSEDGQLLSGVLHLSSLDSADNDRTSGDTLSQDVRNNCASALALVQALVRRETTLSTGLWLVTQGSQSVVGEGPRSLAQSPLWGFGKVVALEHPELACRRVDLESPISSEQLDALLQEFLHPEAEDQIAWRQGKRWVARLRSSSGSTEHLRLPAENFSLHKSADGTIEGLRFEPVQVPPPARGEVQIEVKAVGLNFRDVLNALGMYPGEAGPLGSDVAGRVLAVGPEVTALSVGDEVAGFADGAFADRINVPANRLVHKPGTITFAEAATLPSAFATAQLAFQKAALRAGDRVLIHAAAGGVGLAAVQLAKQIGAQIFATASRSKQSYLRSLGVEHIYDSRTTLFGRQILADTANQGVEVILNSLTGKGFVEASLDALKPGGRFVEIAKREIWTAEQMARTRPDIRFEVLALDQAIAESPDQVKSLVDGLVQRVDRRELRPLPATRYGFAQARSAFRCMQQARHFGKIVLEKSPLGALRLGGEGAYLITGGLGGLGLKVARWLVENGVRFLVLNGRHAAASEAQRVIEELREMGARIELVSANIAQKDEVERLLQHIDELGWQLRGVFHSAGVIRDGALLNQNWQRFEEVLAPKVLGAWHLHRLTLDYPLDLFVLFSSVASLLGNQGQTNYAAANMFLDMLAHSRRASGLPAISINWGPWSEIGAAAERQSDLRSRATLSGLSWISPSSGLEALQRILVRDHCQIGVMPIRWDLFRRDNDDRDPFLAGVKGAKAAGPRLLPPSVQSGINRRLKRAPTEERLRMLTDYLQQELVGALQLPSPPASDTGFQNLGTDSLMAVEIRNRLNKELQLEPALSATALFEFPNVESLAKEIARILGGRDPAPADASRKPHIVETPVEIDAVAVVGLSCRFPHGSDPDDFWELLISGGDAIRPIPGDRWDVAAFYDPDPNAPGKMYTLDGGFLEQVDKFDGNFFEISPREAISLDPQHRMLLELSWEALECGGIDPKGLKGSRTGVYMGLSSGDYADLLKSAGPDIIDAQLSTGTAHSTAVGRISYFFGLHGPSLAIDTACSSSLFAVHQACRDLRSNECNLALAGGVNAILRPETIIDFCKARMLAVDGRCKTFDSAADGYVRGEGGGVVVLKRLNDAQRDGDRILAVIRGSAVNQDGRSSGLTAPSGKAQERVITDALDRAGIKPAEVVYLEAHGTGTNLGDPIEVQAAAAALGKGRKAERPLLIGSVKTNIGHLEAAAGIAGLIKVILAIEHGRIPKHLHFRTPNPHIPWERLAVAVTGEAMPWPEGKKIAGVSSFGFSGTNAHVVIEEPPAESRSEPSLAGERSHHVLVLSARSQSALRQLAGRYRQWLERHPEVRLGDVAYTAGVGRSHLEERAALIIESRERVGQLLASLEQGREAEGLFCQAVKKEPKVAWFFTGQGSQYVGMGRELYQSHAVVREVIDRCDRALSGQREHGLMEVLFKEEALLNHTSYTQPALYALEVALAELWKSWGVEPDVVLGHSVGQYAAAVVAGVMSLEEGLGLIAKRAELMGRLPAGGAMAAVFASRETIEHVLERESELSVAGYNGAHQVLSGPETALEQVLAQLSRQGVRSLRLNTSHAFHSALMEPVLDEFESYGQTIRFRPAQRRLVCNLTGGVLPAEQVLEAGYWRRHIREPVQFERSVQTAAELGVDVVMEMGPRPVLLGMAPHCWPAEIKPAALVTALRPDQSDNRQMAHAFSQCYVHGLNLNFVAWDRSWPRRKLDLPTYPFQRTRYWIESKTRSVGVTPEPQHAQNGWTNGRRHAPMNLSKSPEAISQASELNDTLDLLRSTIADVLRCSPEEIDPDRELSQYGFGSLYIVRAVEQFEAATGFRFPPRAFFENRTMRELVDKGMKEATVSAATGINRSSGRTTLPGRMPRGQAQLQNRPGSFPLSEGQKVLWSIQQSNPNSTAYHVPIAIYWDELIDRMILERVLQQLMIEQPALRASFPFEIAGPVQWIEEPKPVLIHHENLIGLPDAERAEWIRRINEQPFDLEHGPLWRLYVFTISGQRSILMLNFHHLIADGHSAGFLLEELERRYRSVRNGAQEPTRVAQNGIEDSIAIEKRYLAGDSFQRDRAYWLNLFPDGFPLPFTIAGRQGEQTRQRREGEVWQTSVPEYVIRLLEKLASRENVTLQAVFLAALHALLAEAARRQDTVVAVAADTRPSGFEDVVGFFVNMLPIPATLNVSTSFHELVQQVFDRLLGALEHRRFPLRQLVQDLAQAGRNWNELQAAFYFQAAESPEQRRFADRLVLDTHQTGEFDLIFEMIEASRDWHLNVKYRPRVFGRVTIEELAARYNQLLAAISMSTERPLVELVLAEAPARSASLKFEFPERCVHELIEDRVAQTPNEKAVLFQGQHFTYRELDQKANQLARYLIRAGVSRGALVGVMLNRSRELLVGLLAAWKAGAAYVPLDPDHPSDRLKGILRDAKVRVLLTETACPLRPANLRAIEIDREQAAIQGELKTNPITDSSPDDLAYVIYTSGSTGEPKGVQISHRSLAHFLWCMGERPGCTAEDYVLASTTICFDIAALELFLPLITGARLEILPEEIVRNGLRLKQTLENSPATLVQATPATWKMLLAAELGRLPGVKALCGGEAWDTDLADQLLVRTRELWNMYGPTETTIWSSIQKIEPGEPVRLGDPIGNTQFYVFDEAMRPVQPGEIGELFIGGDGLAKGYLNRPELTQERFVLHPTRPKEIIYRTGDLVRYV